MVTGDRHRHVRRGPGRPRPRRHPLHRVHPGVPDAVEQGRARTSQLPCLPTCRRGDRRQGLRDGAPQRRRRRAADRDGARGVRVPGSEVLGRVTGVRATQPLGGHARRPRRRGGSPDDGPDDRLLELHGRRHRRPGLRSALRGARPGARPPTRSRCWPAAPTTTARAASSDRPCWWAPTPPTRSSPPSTSARSSSVHVYEDADYLQTLRQMESASPYALTGSVIAQDRAAIAQATARAALRRGQLLHQRQADGSGGGAAALRRGSRQRHQRQGRSRPEPAALDLARARSRRRSSRHVRRATRTRADPADTLNPADNGVRSTSGGTDHAQQARRRQGRPARPRGPCGRAGRRRRRRGPSCTATTAASRPRTWSAATRSTSPERRSRTASWHATDRRAWRAVRVFTPTRRGQRLVVAGTRSSRSSPTTCRSSSTRSPASSPRQGRAIHLVVHPQLVVRPHDHRRAPRRPRRCRGGRPRRGDARVVDPCRDRPRHRRRRAVPTSRSALRRVLSDVRESVEDWAKMRAAAARVAESLTEEPPPGVPADEVAEARELLEWLVDDHFTFLGRARVRAEAGRRRGRAGGLPGTGLGILRSDQRISSSFDKLPPEVRAKAREPQLLVLTEANSPLDGPPAGVPRLRRGEDLRRRRAR